MDPNPISLDELHKALSGLDELIAETISPPLAEDEATITMVQLQMGEGTTYKTAKNQIARWIKDGRMEYAGKRRIHGREQDAWRILKGS